MAADKNCILLTTWKVVSRKALNVLRRKKFLLKVSIKAQDGKNISFPFFRTFAPKILLCARKFLHV